MTFVVYSQQNNYWYFGRKAGLRFSAPAGQSIPVLLTNSAMDADEAAAAISDVNGNLLFYTNGATVFNKNHQVMINGDNLAGNFSATQIAIVPRPNSDSIFYIFTTDAIENGFVAGYRYSIVDMSLDNDNGTVTTKNSLLFSSCTERMATARHANGIDVWLITNDNNSNIFRSWLITCTGIQPEVVSTAGTIMNQHSGTNSGVMKVSPDGKFLCQTHFPIADEIGHIPNFIQLFDFNNITGEITNPRSISFPDAQYTHCEFSPDSKLLYITRPYDRKIDQLDISTPTIAAITASRVTFPTQGEYYDIQLAPDEKIYLAQPSQSLAVINQPDINGVGCGFQQDAVQLFPKNSYLGLPSHINDIVATTDPNNGFTYAILDSCSGTVQFNSFSTIGGTPTWLWDFGDGTTSTLQNPVHTFTPSSVNYNVKLSVSSPVSCGKIYKSRIIKPSGVLIGKPDFDIIRKCDSGYVRFVNKSASVNQAGIQFLWDFGDGTTSTNVHPIHIYTQPGTYTTKLKTITTTPCLNDSVSKTVDYDAFVVNASPDQTIKVGQSVQLNVTGPPGIYEWSPSLWLDDEHRKDPVAMPLEDIQYKVTVTNGEGCKSEDSVRINVIQYDDIYVPNAFTPNNDGKNDIIRPFYPGYIFLKEFSVYNRWGQRIYSTSQRSAGWDGRIGSLLQNNGVYVWILKAEDKDGNSIEKKGSFVLIR